MRIRVIAATLLLLYSIGGLSAQESGVLALAEEPSMRISSEDLPGDAGLYQIADAITLPDGSILVVQKEEVLRLFPGDGSVSRIGGPGDGPGDYRDPIAATFLDDGNRIRVYDSQNRRITTTWLDGDEVVTERTFREDEVSFLRDGSLVGLQRPKRSIQDIRERTREAGIFSERVDLVLHRDGTQETLTRLEEGAQVRARFHNMTMSEPPPLGRRLIWAAGGTIVVVGYNDSPSLRIIPSDGSLGTRVHTLATRRRVRPSDRRYAEDLFRETGGYPLPAGLDHDWTDHLEFIISEGPKAEYLPLIDTVLVSREDVVWMRRFQLRPSDFHVWEVHHPDERVAATVRIPSDLMVVEIGPAHLLAVERDDFDVEHLVKYDLSRR